MAFIPDGYAQLVFNLSHPAASGALTTTLGVSIDGPLTTAQLVAIGDAFNTNVLSGMSSSVEFDSITAYIGTGDPSAPIIEEATSEWSGGTDSAVGLTINTALLVRKNTGLGGRKNRGRMYVPGIPAGQLSDAGIINGSWIANRQTGWNAFETALTNTATTGVFAPVVLHSQAADGSPTSITSFTVDNVPATQRTRMRD